MSRVYIQLGHFIGLVMFLLAIMNIPMIIIVPSFTMITINGSFDHPIIILFTLSDIISIPIYSSSYIYALTITFGFIILTLTIISILLLDRTIYTIYF